MTTQFLNVFLAAGGQQGGGSFQLIFIGLMIVVFWLFMIRPQAQKAKKQKTFLESLQPGDKVVTIAGIHGKIYKINDDNTYSIEINPGSYLKIEKSTISMEWSQNVQKAAGLTTVTDKK